MHLTFAAGDHMLSCLVRISNQLPTHCCFSYPHMQSGIARALLIALRGICDRANICAGLLLAAEPSASTEASHFCTMQKVGDTKENQSTKCHPRMCAGG